MRISVWIAFAFFLVAGGCGRESGSDAGNLVHGAARKAAETVDEKTREAAKIANKKTDELVQSAENTALQLKITQALAQTKELSSANASILCEKGVVTVSGTVPSPFLREKILNVVQNTRGVKRVIPKINVVPEKPNGN
jgi:osmotically-inducible protein OsmY